MFGKGNERGTGKHGQTDQADKNAIKKAVKCDMCKDQAGGPACVRACPTGAAMRATPETFFQLAQGGDAAFAPQPAGAGRV